MCGVEKDKIFNFFLSKWHVQCEVREGKNAICLRQPLSLGLFKTPNYKMQKCRAVWGELGHHWIKWNFCSLILFIMQILQPMHCFSAPPYSLICTLTPHGRVKVNNLAVKNCYGKTLFDFPESGLQFFNSFTIRPFSIHRLYRSS